jgi:hypothetical protein
MMTGLRLMSLDWDRKERVTPVEQCTIFRTIGIVRPDHVPGSAGAELWRWFAAASAVVERRQASASRWTRAASDDADGRITRLSAFRFL